MLPAILLLLLLPSSLPFSPAPVPFVSRSAPAPHLVSRRPPGSPTSLTALPKPALSAVASAAARAASAAASTAAAAATSASAAASSSSPPLAFFGSIITKTTGPIFICIGLSCMAYKFFFTKNPTAADPPNWKHVVSNEEEEAQLKAFSCSECGYTIFPARGREGKFFPDDYKCGMCGAGRDAFEDRIDEIREGVEKGREGGGQAEVVYEDKDKYSSPRREKTEKTEESEDGGSGEAWAKAVEEGEPDADVEREVELAMEKEKGEGKDEGGGLDLLEMD